MTDAPPKRSINPQKDPHGWLLQAAAAAGFTIAGIAPATADRRAVDGLAQFLRDRFEGDMVWLRDTANRRAAPKNMWPDAQSAIVRSTAAAPDSSPGVTTQTRPSNRSGVATSKPRFSEPASGCEPTN